MRKHSKEVGLIPRWFTKTIIKPLAAGSRKRQIIWFNPPYCQKHRNEYRQEIPHLGRQTLPTRPPPQKDFQQEYLKGILQLYAKHRQHDQKS